MIPTMKKLLSLFTLLAFCAAAQAADFVSDTFTDADSTSLNAHTGETGDALAAMLENYAVIETDGNGSLRPCRCGADERQAMPLVSYGGRQR